MSWTERLRTQKLLSFALVLFTLCAGVVIGTLITSGVKAAKDNPAAPGATPLVIPNPVELSTTFSQIAKQVEPSVVNISTTYVQRTSRTGGQQQRRGGGSPFDDDGSGSMEDFLYRYFGNPFGGGPQAPDRRGEALGSGVVIDGAGYILTNHHVVDKADRIQVKFAGDARQFDAKVIGVDEQTDLAVIKVEGKTNFTPAKIGNSDAVQVGDWAVAIGSPFGFQATVTAGIISAKERDIEGGSTQYQHFLQTDAAINPGNSGGPLLNIRGEVIGINTAIISRSGGYQGIGFALPINTAAYVYNEIIKNGKVTRGSIGIRFTPSGNVGALANLEIAGVKEGVFVDEVAPGGPADKAGIKAGDVIISLNGKPVREGNDLVNTITATPVGTAVDVGVLHDGKRDTRKLVVGDITQIWPDDYVSGDRQGPNRSEGSAVSFGMNILPLTAQRRESLGIQEAGGVLITSVEADSFADEVGLQANDLLLEINRKPVNSFDDVKKIQSTLKPGAAVQFRVMRRAGLPGPEGSDSVPRGRRNGTWQSLFRSGLLPNNSQ